MDIRITTGIMLLQSDPVLTVAMYSTKWGRSFSMLQEEDEVYGFQDSFLHH